MWVALCCLFVLVNDNSNSPAWHDCQWTEMLAVWSTLHASTGVHAGEPQDVCVHHDLSTLLVSLGSTELWLRYSDVAQKLACQAH